MCLLYIVITMNRPSAELLEQKHRHVQRMYNLIAWFPYVCIFAIIWSTVLLIILPIEHDLTKCGLVLAVFISTCILYSTMDVLDYKRRQEQRF